VPDGVRETVAGRDRRATHRDWPPGRVCGSKSLHRALSDARVHDTQSLQRPHKELVIVGAPSGPPDQDGLQSRGVPPETVCPQPDDPNIVAAVPIPSVRGCPWCWALRLVAACWRRSSARLGGVCPSYHYDCRKISTFCAGISQTTRDACGTFLMNAWNRVSPVAGP
jgi:hypothetical protein